MTPDGSVRSGEQVCGHCGHKREDHWAVNFADGPHVGGVVSVCPTSVFTPSKRKVGGWAAVMRDVRPK